jgi:hypothetical protein
MDDTLYKISNEVAFDLGTLLSVETLPLGQDGRHIFPAEFHLSPEGRGRADATCGEGAGEGVL